MAKPRVLILRAPGTNCDIETAYAFEKAGAVSDRVHIRRLLENPPLIRHYQILCVPGGFSYGDDVAAGKILAVQLRHHLLDVLQEFHQADKLILGICNGFQVLLKTGLLIPPDESGKVVATLTWNESARYEDRWVHLKVASDRCVFLRGIDRLELPIAHAEGRFVVRHAEWLDRLAKAGQIALQYVLPSELSELATRGAAFRAGTSSTSTAGIASRCLVGVGTTLLDGLDKMVAEGDWRQVLPYPWNPNGSMGNIAGACDRTGRVLGLMPHPERFIDPTHHPRWTRGERREPPDGLRLFVNAVAYFS